MTPRSLILLGASVGAVAVVLALVGASLTGPTVPHCAGRPFADECVSATAMFSLVLKVVSLPVGIVGGLLVAVGLGRRAAEAEQETHPAAGPGDEPDSGKK